MAMGTVTCPLLVMVLVVFIIPYFLSITTIVLLCMKYVNIREYEMTPSISLHICLWEVLDLEEQFRRDLETGTQFLYMSGCHLSFPVQHS